MGEESHNMATSACNAEQQDPEQTLQRGITRRSFAIGAGSVAALLGLGALRYLGSESLVRPPGGQNEEALVSKCVHCYRCMEVCPRELIVSTSIESGVLNSQTPHLNFSDNNPGVLDALKFCDFCAEANDGVPLCVEVCPSSALKLDDGVNSTNVIIGKAELNTNLCIAYRSSYCAFCYDACLQVRGADDAAIYYQDAGDAGDNSTRLPKVDFDKCNGCGACESVCVSAQAGSTMDAGQRAIVVKPLEG